MLQDAGDRHTGMFMLIRSALLLVSALLTTLIAVSAVAVERLDPDADFGSFKKRLIVEYGVKVARDMPAEATRLSALVGERLRFLRSLAVPGHHLFELEAPGNGRSIGALRALLERFPEVASVEEDRLLQAHFSPDDPLYTGQWHYQEATGGINLPPAWEQHNGSQVVVAVLDTGITFHTDLVGNLLPGYDFIRDTQVANDGDGRDGDASDPGDWLARWECGRRNPPRDLASSWHGTHTAGTVAAVSNNGLGVAGVAFGARVLPVRVLGKCGGYTSDIADGIVWASGGTVSGVAVNGNPAQVISMSLGGGGGCGSTLQGAVNMARANGATVIASAGNSNANASGFSPANCAGVITVAANDREGNRAFYSNYGAVDVTAPGGETGNIQADGVSSTLNDGTTSPGNESYAFYQGTSMAAPHVAGVAALLYAAKPTITPDEVAAVLETTARPLPGSCSGGCGAGIVDAGAALDLVAGGTPGNRLPVAGFSYAATLLSVHFTDTSRDDDGVIVSWHWDFGNGATATSQHPQITFPASGSYTVRLTVIDDLGGQDSTSQLVEVADGLGGGLTLSADGFKVKGRHRVALNWSGALADQVHLYRDDQLLTVTDNDGAHLDVIGQRGGATYRYLLCDAATSSCSSEVRVSF
jgi:serine protease